MEKRWDIEVLKKDMNTGHLKNSLSERDRKIRDRWEKLYRNAKKREALRASAKNIG
jgi:hypothetical protein